MLSIVIPVHDEEDSIAETVRGLWRHLHAEGIDHEILVINDGSSDGTEDVVRSCMGEIPTLRYSNNGPPNGFGFAVRRGLELYRGDVVATVMGDASDLPEDVVRYYRTLEATGADCVFGSRWVRGGSTENYPAVKRSLNRLVNNFIRLLFGFRYNDVTNAFKMYRRSVIDGVQPLLSHHFNLTVELPLKAIVRGFSYEVVPNSWRGRQKGQSKLLLKEMGSRYLFIVLYCFIENWLSAGDYRRERAATRSGEIPARDADPEVGAPRSAGRPRGEVPPDAP